MKHYLLLILTLLFSFSLSAQENRVSCGTDDYHEELYETDSKYHDAYDETKAFLKKNKIKNYKTVTTLNGTEYHVPVVVHVIDTGGAIGTLYNPSDATINAMIAQINNGFANTFDNTSVAGGFNGVDIPIRFYLAQRTEACAATTGINRVNFSGNATYVASGVQRGSTQPGVPDATIKALAHWNDYNYYNIYIVNKINGVDGNCAPCSYVAGYANYPVLGGSTSDGMVCLAWAAANATSTTFIHELGHGFNLVHTFQGGNSTTCPPNGACSSDNDEVCDTEPMRQSFTCNPSGNNPCTAAPYAGGQWNYMSYNSCDDRYTAGQRTRAMAALNGVRTSLKNSAGIDPPPAALPGSISAPTYNNANNPNNFNVGPRNVTFNTIDHTSHGFSFEGSGFQHYIDNTCNQSTTLIEGNAYTLDVETRLNSQGVRVWVDWNNDGVFAATTERVMSSTGTGGTQTHTAMVSTPVSGTALNVPLRMRVISDLGSPNGISPTGQLNYGQAEDFTVTVVGAPLSVLWRSISANLNYKNNIDVRWATELETNSSYFEIEKSKDGVYFYKIGSLEAAGSSAQRTYYNFEDQLNLTGYNYYRIKQVDLEGNISYSDIATEVIQSNETDIVIFPNPTSGDLFINIDGLINSNTKVRYIITDLNGKVWTSKEVLVSGKRTKITEDMSNMPSGLYFVQMMVNGKLSTHKIAKQF